MISKKTKNIIIAIILLILVAGVVVGIVSRMKKTDDSYNATANAVYDNLPTMSAYYKGTKVGEIYGYTNELDESTERKNIVVIPPSRNTEFRIKQNGNEIESIQYEVKSTEDGRLVDNGPIEKMKKDGDINIFSYHANAIVETGKEYRLRFIVSTNKHESINYYARLIVSNNEFVKKQISFIKKFSNRTFAETQNSSLAAYLEPSERLKSNDNLGNVNINSSYTMLIWGTMSASKIGKTSVTTRECVIRENGNSCTYTLNYQMKARNAQKVTEKYNVAETFTVWTYMGKEYLIGYNRDVNQIWTANNHNVGNAFIDLGIQSEDYLEHAESANGKYIAYSVNGDVYSFDLENKNIYQIYNLGASTREQSEMTKAKAVGISNKGVVDYMIYGYSRANNHKGRNGISIMRFDPKANKSVEKAFIPCNTSASVLDKQLQTLCHVGDGTLYIMVDNTIYFANLKTQEWGVVVSNLDNDSFAVSDDGRILAYNSNATKENSDEITILNLDNGNKKTIKAKSGEKISVCGFTGNNLIYGIAQEKDTKKQGQFAISELVITSDKLEEKKRYFQPGIFIKEIEIKDNIIHIKRFKNHKSVSEDQILDNTEENASAAKFSYYTDDVKMKEMALAFATKLAGNTKLTIKTPGEVEFKSDAEIQSDFEKAKANKYYVYGYGKLQDICTSKGKAIAIAKKKYGLVVNNKGKKIWTKEEHYREK